jgi:hypothetical protein
MAKRKKKKTGSGSHHVTVAALPTIDSINGISPPPASVESGTITAAGRCDNNTNLNVGIIFTGLGLPRITPPSSLIVNGTSWSATWDNYTVVANNQTLHVDEPSVNGDPSADATLNVTV